MVPNNDSSPAFRTLGFLVKMSLSDPGFHHEDNYIIFALKSYDKKTWSILIPFALFYVAQTQ